MFIRAWQVDTLVVVVMFIRAWQVETLVVAIFIRAELLLHIFFLKRGVWENLTRSSFDECAANMTPHHSCDDTRGGLKKQKSRWEQTEKVRLSKSGKTCPFLTLDNISFKSFRKKEMIQRMGKTFTNRKSRFSRKNTSTTTSLSRFARINDGHDPPYDSGRGTVPGGYLLSVCTCFSVAWEMYKNIRLLFWRVLNTRFASGLQIVAPWSAAVYL